MTDTRRRRRDTYHGAWVVAKGERGAGREQERDLRASKASRAPTRSLISRGTPLGSSGAPYAFGAEKRVGRCFPELWSPLSVRLSSYAEARAPGCCASYLLSSKQLEEWWLSHKQHRQQYES